MFLALPILRKYLRIVGQARQGKARQGKEGEELKDRELEMPEQES